MPDGTESRSLGCARCGDCCENIYLGVYLTDLSAWSTKSLANVPDPRTDEGWAWWISEDRRSETVKPWSAERRDIAIVWYDPEGERRHNADFLSEHWTVDHHDDDGAPVYRCDQFNAETRLCEARDERPPVCSGYPWYGRGPQPGTITKSESRCSYLLDLKPADRPEGARPLIPIEVVR